jgi:hypothetical protein
VRSTQKGIFSKLSFPLIYITFAYLSVFSVFLVNVETEYILEVAYCTGCLSQLLKLIFDFCLGTSWVMCLVRVSAVFLGHFYCRKINKLSYPLP